jgi:hypothetical protein
MSAMFIPRLIGKSLNHPLACGVFLLILRVALYHFENLVLNSHIEASPPLRILVLSSPAAVRDFPSIREGYRTAFPTVQFFHDFQPQNTLEYYDAVLCFSSSSCISAESLRANVTYRFLNQFADAEEVFSPKTLCTLNSECYVLPTDRARLTVMIGASTKLPKWRVRPWKTLELLPDEFEQVDQTALATLDQAVVSPTLPSDNWMTFQGVAVDFQVVALITSTSALRAYVHRNFYVRHKAKDADDELPVRLVWSQLGVASAVSARLKVGALCF